MEAGADVHEDMRAGAAGRGGGTMGWCWAGFVVAVMMPRPTRELCVMACVFCKDPQFHDWLNHLAGEEISDDSPFTENGAKAFILSMCGVTSRTQLDSDAIAGMAFHARIREPFLAWKEAA